MFRRSQEAICERLSPRGQTDEASAREALYGPLTRSGRVNLTPLRADEDGRMLDGYWCEWEWIDRVKYNPVHAHIYAGMLLNEFHRLFSVKA